MAEPQRLNLQPPAFSAERVHEPTAMNAKPARFEVAFHAPSGCIRTLT